MPLPSLFPNMEVTLQAYNANNGHIFSDESASDALAVFHLKGCGVCEKTLGAIEYEMQQPDSVIKHLNVHPFQLQVNSEGGTTKNDCYNSQECKDDSLLYLGTDIEDQYWHSEGYPQIYYYDGTGNKRDIGDQDAAFTVRGTASDNCTSKNPENCASVRNAVSNWICGVVTNQQVPCNRGDCDDEWYKTQPQCFSPQ